ncbi:extracellular solute-binding protein [Paenibacillus soyae]|uniref:Extracellular solute-binding protein n=1 Tax=Paenibacillus soyae TaxID=2969249 RepID=A0A9X2MR80_9BACL|nr:extracellular solute-binding protein [Paenibacillus soyae]MCR2804704.1 extracellular solute-binding protein [Paenibacillus soyae]
MKKKMLVLVVAVSMMMSMIAACSTKESEENNSENAAVPQNFNATGFPVVNEKVTLKLMGAKAANQGPWDQMMFFEEMERLTNIHFEFDTPDNKVFQEKKNLTFASDNLPDVFFAGSLTTFDQINYGKQGLLIPLEDLIDQYAPNFKALMDKNPAIRRAITAPDGHIYALPQVSDIIRDMMFFRTYLNAEWMEALGNPQVAQTTDELLELLKRFRDEDPNKNGKQDELPLSFLNVKNDSLNIPRTYIMPAFGVLEDRPNQSRLQVSGDKVSAVFMSEGYKEFLKYMKTLHDEKLLDPEIFTHTDQQLKAKGQEGLIGMTMHAAPFSVFKVEKPEDNEKYPLVMPLTSAMNSEKLFTPRPNITIGTFAITKNNPHPEATMRWVDYLYTTEGFMLGNQGIEGEAWKWKDDNKNEWERITPEGMNKEEFRAQNTPDIGSTIPLLKSMELNYKQNDLVNNILNKQADELSQYAKEAMPLLFLSEEEESRANILKNDLMNYIAQMEAKFVLGKESFDNWDAYVSTLKKMNVDEYVEIYQKAYDRWIATN